MLQNKFRINRMKIKELLIDSFAAENFDIKKYIKTSIPYEWESIGLKKITDGSYESTLIKFLESKSKSQNHYRIITIGDTGTGKSSSLKYALEMARKCHDCTADCNHKPLVIYFDFLNSGIIKRPDTELIDDHDERQGIILVDEFWQQLLYKLDEHVIMSDEEEKNIFWGWLLSEFRGHLYLDLYKSFSGYEQKIKNNNLSEIDYDTIKKDIRVINTNSENLFKYKLLQIAFSRREYEGACHLVAFDNLDSLEPALQREALRLSHKINEMLSAKVLVPMRPHTFTINIDAANFNEVLSHWSPDIFKVIEFRIRKMIDSHNEEIKTIGYQLLEVYSFISETKYAKDLFVQTCGLSVRFALRNFYNFLLSPLVYWDKDELQIKHIGRNEFYQAYFCSETDDQLMYEHNFVNLFSLKTHDGGVIYSNIKLRILYFLSKGTGTSVRDIRNKMELFGYNDVQICAALNDMLRRKTALIWSDNSLHYTEKMLSESHVLKLTPIGICYFNSLISDIRYMRECVMSCDGKRETQITQWTLRCWEVFKELVRNDYNEMITYLERSTVNSYQLMYDSIGGSISLFLWNKLSTNLKYLAYKHKLQQVDTEYENAIKKNVESILKFKMLEIQNV